MAYLEPPTSKTLFVYCLNQLSNDIFNALSKNQPINQIVTLENPSNLAKYSGVDVVTTSIDILSGVIGLNFVPDKSKIRIIEYRRRNQNGGIKIFKSLGIEVDCDAVIPKPVKISSPPTTPTIPNPIVPVEEELTVEEQEKEEEPAAEEEEEESEG